MTYFTSDIEKKLGIKRGNIHHFIDAIPLAETKDYKYIMVGNIRLLQFNQSGYNKLKNRNRKTGRKPFKIKG